MLTVVAVVLLVLVGAAAVATIAGRNKAATPDAGAVPVAAVAASPNNPVERFVEVLRRRRGLRIGLSLLSVALLIGAGGLIGYPFYTNQVQGRLQDHLENQFASDELRDAYLNRRVGEGDSLTRLIIPAIEVDVVVVEGISPSALRAGAGHYPSTPLPCEIGNVAIAGHRTTYGKPLHNMDLLKAGDEITLQTPIGECVYQVDAPPTVHSPKDLAVLTNTSTAATLTLTTCHPKGSAAQRLVLKATMVRTQPFDT